LGAAAFWFAQVHNVWARENLNLKSSPSSPFDTQGEPKTHSEKHTDQRTQSCEQQRESVPFSPLPNMSSESKIQESKMGTGNEGEWVQLNMKVRSLFDRNLHVQNFPHCSK